MDSFNFNDIRSFRDNEVHDKLLSILDDEEFIYILKRIFPDNRIAHLNKELNTVDSITDFQKKYISDYVKALIQLTIVVISVTIIAGFILAGADFTFTKFISWITFKWIR